MMKPLVLILFGICSVIVIMTDDALAFRCDGKIVSIEDRTFEVRMKCGEPTLSDRWTQDHVNTVFNRETERYEDIKTSVIREEWMYNFGPDRFLQFLTFENDRLIHVETGKYGYAEALPRKSVEEGCAEEGSIGNRKLDILANCGEPASEISWTEERVQAVYMQDEKKYYESKVSVKIDEWTFNFGPNRLIYIFRFEDGRLVDIKTGGYGYEK